MVVWFEFGLGVKGGLAMTVPLRWESPYAVIVVVQYSSLLVVVSHRTVQSSLLMFWRSLQE